MHLGRHHAPSSTIPNTMTQLIEYHSHDIDDQASSLSDWQQRYEQLGCGRFHGSVWQLVMPGGALVRETTNRQLREQFSPPANHVALALPLSVMPGSMFMGRPLLRDSLMVMPANSEYDMVSAGTLDLIGMVVHCDTLNATLTPSELEWLNRAEHQGHRYLPAEVASAMRRRLLAICNDAQQQLKQPRPSPLPLGATAEPTLLPAALVHTVSIAMTEDAAEWASTLPRRADTRQRVVKRAMDFTHANLHNNIGVPDICAAAFASRRTLQYCFEEFLHTTPQTYLRALRLNEARRKLKRSADLPITTVAFALGFNSASNFTKHYKHMFGELPSQTFTLNGNAST
jgi:AraC family ethanolamine operon transcriptional activator